MNCVSSLIIHIIKQQHGDYKQLMSGTGCIHWIINKLNDELFRTDNKLNKSVLCENCKRKKIEKLTEKCGNEELASLLYECKLNIEYYDSDDYIRWIPFDEFENTKYLAKGSFEEVHKATWINSYYDEHEKKYK